MDCTGHGGTPLMAAAAVGNVAVLKLLIEGIKAWAHAQVR